MKYALKAAASAAALMMATPALADVEIFTTPGALQPSENVLLNTGATGTVILGTTNQTGTSVLFTSLTCTGPTTCTTVGAEAITAPSNGQARVEAVDGSLDALMISLAGGQTFLEFEFNVFNGIDAVQSLTIFGMSGGVNGEAFQLTWPLDDNGENYFSGRAFNGQVFTSVQFNASATGAADVRQIRLGGIGQISPPIPEPSTWAMMLLGFGAVGFSVRRSRAKQGLALKAIA